jgi:hypothetical protein
MVALVAGGPQPAGGGARLQKGLAGAGVVEAGVRLRGVGPRQEDRRAHGLGDVLQRDEDRENRRLSEGVLVRSSRYSTFQPLHIRFAIRMMSKGTIGPRVSVGDTNDDT